MYKYTVEYWGRSGNFIAASGHPTKKSAQQQFGILFSNIGKGVTAKIVRDGDIIKQSTKKRGNDD